MAELFELFGIRTDREAKWAEVVAAQQCPYTGRRCFKVRKSDPTVSIGTCTGRFGAAGRPLIICPHRFLANRHVFTDCLPLLQHRAGNELHIVPEIRIPGGNVDYFLVSARAGIPTDFVGVEFQTLDTTGSVWPIRQEFLRGVGVTVPLGEAAGTNAGVNWKMTAKTILVQLHHKIETFEALKKKFVLVIQDDLMTYMTNEFSFAHLSTPPVESDSMLFHAYALNADDSTLRLAQVSGTNMAGIATALNLGASAEMQPEELVEKLRSKMGPQTRWNPV